MRSGFECLSAGQDQTVDLAFRYAQMYDWETRGSMIRPLGDMTETPDQI
ncbi:hypothetical protein B0G73_11513 [Paraburkholderia sp. BL25I1N1]|nr:hypothetical protein B0G73_11513 [Paraburkholderia sp. BL25I1N1]